MDHRLPALLILLALVPTAQGQPGSRSERVEILHADQWNYDERIAPGTQRLIGNVRLKHAQALMFCDSAYLHQDQRIDAFSRVRIVQGDSLEVEADRLHYNGTARTARLDGNVRLRDSDMELRTPSLDHDMRAKRSVYIEGGQITSQQEGNTLTSRSGTYFSDTHLFIFSRNVRLEHPERLILSDTMHYVTATGIARFFGPTTIQQFTDSTLINTLRGRYDTRSGKARFDRRSSIRSKGRLLEGDSLHYDRGTGIGLAWGNVAVTDTTGDLLVRGGHGRYDEPNDRSMITGNAELLLLMDGDTLFLHGDTLFTAPSSSVDSLGNSRQGKRIQAHRNVRFFKSDMQGSCDTLVYSGTDSLIRMYHRPVLWTGSDQISGRTIRIALRNGRAHRLYIDRDAFLMSVVDSSHFDQVTGSTMTGYFDDAGLRRLTAEGNSRTVYFAREARDGKEEIIGVNRADCSRIEVGLADGKLHTVTFLDRPDAILYPLGKVPPEELRMKGSEWRGAERPEDRNAIFRR